MDVTTRIDLNGTWGLGWDDTMRKISARPMLDTDDGPFIAEAQVPGEIHLDLIRAGLAEEPNLGLNTARSRWIDDTLWWYHRDVEIDAKTAGKRTWLCFDQLDLTARIFVNGSLVGTHANSFYPYRVEVTEQLQAGKNHIAVEIQASAGVVDKTALLLEKTADLNKYTRPWMRKPSYQWGWDWSSKYLNVGIGGDAYLLVANSDIIVNRAVPLADVSEDLATATVRARVELQNISDKPVSVKLAAKVAGASAEATVEVAPGEDVYEVVVEVPNPELWWPNGQGAQKLHDLEIRVTGKGIDEVRTKTVGFRRLVIDQSPHPLKGKYFVVTVNNRPVFCKGGNTAPLDSIPARIDRARYEKFIDLAVESNFNFLRVNGVGLYESDVFYELCDKAGIMVWQDFTFSCSWYPGHDQAFLEDIQKEAIHQVRRIASHPSLAIWCGQNESEWLYRKDDWTAPNLPDYHIFHLLIPRVLEHNNPSVYYAPCSPHSPGSTDYPNDDFSGDQHPWLIGMGNWDIRDYRVQPARFSSEGGILGPGSLATLKEIVGEHDDNPVSSPGFHLHDNWIGQVTMERRSVPEDTLSHLFGKEPSELTLEQYAYWGGLVQSEGLREYVENYRRRWPDCAAAIFWAFNDSWPTTRSWTTIDYYQRRTPGFWSVKRTMAPVTVVVAPDGDTVNVYGVNDTTSDVTGELTSGFFGTAGGGSSETATVTLPAGKSTLLRSLGAWQGDPASSIPFAVLSRPGELDARSRLIGPVYTDVKWAPAGSPKVTVKDGVATFESDVFVLGVCIDLDGDRPLPDNMFDLFPGQPYSMPWPYAEAPKVLHTGNLA